MKIGLVFNLFLSFLKVLRLSDTKSISCFNHYSSCTIWDEVYALLTVAASFVYCAVLDKNILEIIGKELMVQLNVELNLGSLTQFRTKAEQTADRRCRYDVAMHFALTQLVCPAGFQQQLKIKSSFLEVGESGGLIRTVSTSSEWRVLAAGLLCCRLLIGLLLCAQYLERKAGMR